MTVAVATLTQRTHCYPLRIYIEDTDAAGLVYYANYLKFTERARSEMLRDCHVPHAQMIRDNRCTFVVRQCRVDYLKPGVLEDQLVVETFVQQLKGMTLTLQQHVKRNDEELVRMEVKLACINDQHKPTRIPVAIGDALRAHGFLAI